MWSHDAFLLHLENIALGDEVIELTSFDDAEMYDVGSTNQSYSSSGSSAAVIGGILVGVVIGMAVIGYIGIKIKRNMRKRLEDNKYSNIWSSIF